MGFTLIPPSLLPRSHPCPGVSLLSPSLLPGSLPQSHPFPSNSKSDIALLCSGLHGSPVTSRQSPVSPRVQEVGRSVLSFASHSCPKCLDWLRCLLWAVSLCLPLNREPQVAGTELSSVDPQHHPALRGSRKFVEQRNEIIADLNLGSFFPLPELWVLVTTRGRSDPIHI